MPNPLPLTLAQAEALTQVHGTPLQIYDEAAIRGCAQHLLRTMAAQFPSFRQFFAVKALPNPAILKVLIEEGCGLDCSSAAELHIARVLGVPGDRVMYTSNYTSKADLAAAFDMGAIINLDDPSLVDDLVAVRGRVPELICFRLNPGLGRTDSETASNVLGGPDAKFGVPETAIVEAFRAAQRAGASRFGLHMMTGSCVLNNDYWAETVGVLIRTVAAIRSALNIEFEFVNIGGGMGIPYRPGQPPVDVALLAATVRRVLDAAAAREGLPGLPALYMENGRYLVGPHGWLLARCTVVKRTYPAAAYYGLDACMANLMRPGMYGSYHHITVPAREDAAASCQAKEAVEGGAVPRAAAHVVGQLCENNDWFAKDRSLPASAAAGDLFVIHDTGAHAHSMGFQYNGKLRAPELLLRAAGSSGSTLPRADIIRARETVDCLFTLCSMPADLDRPMPPPAAGSTLGFPTAPQRPFPYSGGGGAPAVAPPPCLQAWLGAHPVAAAAVGLCVLSAAYLLLCPSPRLRRWS